MNQKTWERSSNKTYLLLIHHDINDLIRLVKEVMLPGILFNGILLLRQLLKTAVQTKNFLIIPVDGLPLLPEIGLFLQEKKQTIVAKKQGDGHEHHRCQRILAGQDTKPFALLTRLLQLLPNFQRNVLLSEQRYSILAN